MTTAADMTEFRWAEFLDERRRLIHYFHDHEGLSDAQICAKLSMDVTQVTMIRAGTKAGPPALKTQPAGERDKLIYVGPSESREP